MSDLIKVEIVDGIQVITINRPEAKNAINLETAQAMAEALEQLDARDDVRIGILTGAGGTFSSGMDVKAFAQSGQRPLVPGRGRETYYFNRGMGELFAAAGLGDHAQR